MITLLLWKLLPALLPIVLYGLYRLIAPQRGDAVIDAKRTSHWPWVLLLSLLISFTLIVYGVVTTPSNAGHDYTPSYLEDGRLMKETRPQ